MTRASVPDFYRLGLIGYPLGHSLSPGLHQAALTAAGLRGEYRLFALPPTPEGQAAIMARIEDLRMGVLHGLNVTIPHKQTVIPLVDGLSDTALAVGAVNTLFAQAGKVYGDNTDVPGFLHDVQRLKVETPGRALVLGAGGSARAVVYALAKTGWQVLVLARREEQADAVVLELRKGQLSSAGIRAGQMTVQVLAREADGVDLLVNTTPLGMSPHNQGCPWPQDLPLPSRAAVYDLVYNPRTTVLVQRARAARLQAMTGGGMLIAQAALSFQRWTGLEPPYEVMEQAFWNPEIQVGTKR